MFSANLRLSNKQISHEQKLKRVEETINELGLAACADTKVWGVNKIKYLLKDLRRSYICYSVIEKLN
jgi:hypothetical protein